MAAVRRCPPWVLAAVLAGLYLAIDPPSADLAAQSYRAWLFDHQGLVLWDNAWYAGHHMPGYSVLFPALAGLLGPRLVGALSAVAAAWLFERLAEEHFGRVSRAGEWWFSAATAVNLVTGRLTFALGVTLALAAVLAATHRHGALAVACAVLCTLASPVAGLFLALGAAAWFLGGGRPGARGGAVALGAAALAPALFLTVAFPEGGDEPFTSSAFWPAVLTLLAVRLALPRRERVMRIALDLYVVATVASFVIDTPMGGNVTRLGAVFAMPLIAAVVWRRRPWAVMVLAIPVLYWQWYPPVRDWHRAHGDPSLHAGYYDGLVGFLRAQERGAPPFRVEVPFTVNHWESRWLAPHAPLARGWERQLDRKVNALFYDEDHPLTAARYERWLSETAVRFVALPDVELDHSAQAEGRLLRAGLEGLRPVWRDAHWRVWAVRRPRPIAPGLTALGTDTFTLRASGPGDVPVRIRWTPYWRASGACLARDGDWTVVRARRAGVIRVTTRFSLGRIGSDGCAR